MVCVLLCKILHFEGVSIGETVSIPFDTRNANLATMDVHGVCVNLTSSIILLVVPNYTFGRSVGCSDEIVTSSLPLASRNAVDMFFLFTSSTTAMVSSAVIVGVSDE